MGKGLRAPLAFFVALLFLFSSSLRADVQRAALKKVQKQFATKKGLGYARALLKLGQHADLSLFERQKALRISAAQVRKLKPARPRLAMRVSLAQAELEGLRMRWSRRRSFLRRAEKFAVQAKRKQGAKNIARVRNGEKQVPKLARAAQRSGTKMRTLRRSEQAQIKSAQDLLKQESRLKQDLMALQIQCWLLPLQLLDSDKPLEDAAGRMAALDKALASQPRLAVSRHALLRWLSAYYAAQNNWQQAARWALKADRVQVVKAGQPLWNLKDPGDYCRSQASQKICMLAQQNQVDCYSLEKQLFNKACFFDYSSMKEQGDFDRSLAAEVVQTYSPLLRNCLIKAAQAGELLPGAKVELSWTTVHNGRVRDVQIRPHRYLGGAYEKCIRSSFARFRYPPYRGEIQHTALQFRVND